MRRTISLALFLLLAAPAFAQQDTLRDQILNYENNTSEMIRKGRQMIADKLAEGDFAKVAEVKQYLEENVQDPQYAVFNVLENWLLQYWTRNYKGLLQDIPAINPAPGRRDNRIYPPRDILLMRLQQMTHDSLPMLKASIRESDLSGAAADFLLLHLTYLFPDKEQGSRQDSLNAMADRYLENYPNSIHDGFIREYIRIKYTPSKWAYAMNFFSGYTILTGDLAEQFKNPVALGLAFDGYYQRLAMYLNIHLGISKTREDILYDDGIWAKKSGALFAIPDISAGYVLAESNRFKVVPFAGVGGTEIGPVQRDLDKDPQLDRATYKFTFTPVIGLNTDFKLKTRTNQVWDFYREENYAFIRLRYTYHLPQLDNRYGVGGNIHSIAVGIGGFGRRMKRER